MWIKKLKKKKFQFILVALMLCFTSAIFAACISFVCETSRFTDRYTSYENCPAAIAVADNKYDPAYFEKDEKLMEHTEQIKTAELILLKSNFTVNGRKIKTYFNTAYFVDDISDFMHSLKMAEGNEKKPEKGEVWICTVCADSYSIKIGDYIKAGSDNGAELKVSGIVATPVCPSPYMGTMPYYINRETADMLDGTSFTGFSFYSDGSMSGIDYVDRMPEEFTVEAISIIDSDGIYTSIAYLADIFGGVGLIASAVIFAVSIIIIKFIITSNIAREYREIGTYKALGFTEKQITGFYLKSFIFAGGFGILIGTALSFILTKYLCNMVLRHLGSFSLSWLSVVLSAGALVLLTVMLAAGVMISLRKIRKVTPVEAFNAESKSTKRKTAHSFIKSAYSPLSVAVNDIVRKKRASIMTVTVLTVSFYMCFLFSGINYSLERMADNTGVWFAFPQYDSIMSVNSDENQEEFLKNYDGVEKYVFSNSDIGMSGIRCDCDSINMSDIYLEIYSDCSEETLNIPLIDGRHPKSQDEILMSYDMAVSSGVGIGNWFHLENDNYSGDYLVCGLFSSMYNGGRNLIMDGDEYFKFGLPDKYMNIMVFLKDNTTYEEFEKAAKEALPNSNVASTVPFLEGSVNSLNSVSKPLTTMFVIIFSVFSILNIVNLLLMNNIENRRQYGILKAMGFTNRYICTKNILKIGLLTAIAAILSTVINIFLSQKIFFAVIHVNGLIENCGLASLVLGSLCGMIIIAALLFTLPMGKVSPTELMEE